MALSSIETNRQEYNCDWEEKKDITESSHRDDDN